MKVLDLGVIKYEDALGVQKDLLHKRIEGKISDTLIICEHPAVVTFGRRSREDAVKDREFFSKRGIPFIFTARGGQNTYHSPGQIVLYPIIDLREKRKSISAYIDFLEKTVTNSLIELGVHAYRDIKRRGIWAGSRKIGFIGIALKGWVTFHGVAVNINNDTTPFISMHPCGEEDIKVVSAREIIGGEMDMKHVKTVFAERFIRDLGKEYGKMCNEAPLVCAR